MRQKQLPEREIKFMAWDKKEKKMIPVFHWHKDDNEHYVTHLVFAGSGMLFVGDDIELIQYTGWHDNARAEIYEGHIIAAAIYGDEPAENFLVYFNKEVCGYVIDYDDGDGDFMSLGEFPGPIWIMGNIFEHPWLLCDNTVFHANVKDGIESEPHESCGLCHAKEETRYE